MSWLKRTANMWTWKTNGGGGSGKTRPVAEGRSSDMPPGTSARQPRHQSYHSNFSHFLFMGSSSKLVGRHQHLELKLDD